MNPNLVSVWDVDGLLVGYGELLSEIHFTHAEVLFDDGEIVTVEWGQIGLVW